MYTIIGGDGKEYGPVTAEQVQVWIAAGRANLQTRAKALGTDDWKSLGDFSDFSGASRNEPPVVGSAPLAGAEEIAAQLKARAGELDIASCYERSWTLLKSNFWPLVGVSALVYVITFVIGQLSDFALGQVGGSLSSIIISILFFAGLQYYILKKIRGQPTSLGDAFAGFTTAFLPLIFGGLVVAAIMSCGFVMYVLPNTLLVIAYVSAWFFLAIYLMVAYTFAWLLIVDQKLDLWTALEVSRRVVTAQWWRVMGLILLGVVSQYSESSPWSSDSLSRCR